MSKIKYVLPFIFLFALFALMWYELFYTHPGELPSALIGQPLPNFSLARLDQPPLKFTQQQLAHKKVVLINFWASWCSACAAEHQMLLNISQNYHVPIYGINYKDNADDAKKWLQTHGNPYAMIGSDSSGNAGIDFGIYGTPETFVVTASRRIVYRQIGAIDQQTWDNVIYPLVQKYE